MNSERFSNIASGVLVLCALTVTGLLLRREFGTSPTPAAAAAFPRPWSVRPADAEEARSAGHATTANASGPRIVVFSDYECPFCRDLDETLDGLQERHPSAFTVAYRHYPLRIHRQAVPAAVAAECAARLGAFPQYHRLLFAMQDSLGAISWTALASRAGVGDTARFTACLAEDAPRQQVAKDTLLGNRMKITGTPAMLVGDEILAAALPADSVEAWLVRAGILARP